MIVPLQEVHINLPLVLLKESHISAKLINQHLLCVERSHELNLGAVNQVVNGHIVVLVDYKGVLETPVDLDLDSLASLQEVFLTQVLVQVGYIATLKLLSLDPLERLLLLLLHVLLAELIFFVSLCFNSLLDATQNVV